MIYYHFTSAKHFALIQQSGIALGVIPWQMLPSGEVKFKKGFQWLTTNPDWDQTWDAPFKANLPYRRTEYRIALDIPSFALHTLFRWSEFANKHKPGSAAFLNSLGGTKHWYLFRGPIPTTWFIATDRNPNQINLPEINESN